MSNKLDGSFSGLWTCELCGKTGVECTCEHFARNATQGRNKQFLDSELAAELWYAVSMFQAADAVHELFDTDDTLAKRERERERMFVMQGFAEGTDRKILEG
jgi:hypothetical protein